MLRTMRQNGDSQEVCVTSSIAQISIEVSKHKLLTSEYPELSLDIGDGQDSNRQEEKGGSADRKQGGQGSSSQQTEESEQQRARTVNSQGALPPCTARILNHQERTKLALPDSVHKQTDSGTSGPMGAGSS